MNRSCYDHLAGALAVALYDRRRHHLAGEAGKQLLVALLDRGWLRRGRQPRSVDITREGRHRLPEVFGVEL